MSGKFVAAWLLSIARVLWTCKWV